MTNIKEVEQILINKPTNLTARRWLKNKPLLNKILKSHSDWNEDHSIHHPDMVFTLEENINYFLENPSLIEEEREPSE